MRNEWVVLTNFLTLSLSKGEGGNPWNRCSRTGPNQPRSTSSRGSIRPGMLTEGASPVRRAPMAR